jgi:endoglucanase
MTGHKWEVLSVTAALFAVLALSATGVSAGPVSRYGRLYAAGGKIVGENSNNAAVQLKGPSMQWSVSGWGSDRFFIKETVDAMVDGWNAQIIRAPLGVDVVKRDKNITGGYISKPEENWGRVKTVVDAAIARDIYAIVDWHSHNAHEPDVAALAADFFTNPNRAGVYGNNPAVIFEIYNEPEDDANWAEVKAYSNKVIRAIRDAGFKNMILVGSPYWDLQTDIAANDPPGDPENNIAFVFHFYAAEHSIDKPFWLDKSKTFRSIVQGALDAGKPVFVSEWGTNDATDATAPDFVETDKWHAFLNANKISSCAWGLTASNYNVLDYWTRIGSPLNYDIKSLESWTNPGMMTAHGRYIYRWLTGKDTAYSSAIPVLPEYKGPKAPIALSSYDLYDYTNDGGTTSLRLENGTARLIYSLEQGDYEYTPYAGFGFDIDTLYKCEYGIGYAYRGGAHTIRAEQGNVDDYAYHSNLMPTDEARDWTEVTVPWELFRQPEWGVEVRQDVFKVKALSWEVEAPAKTAGELFIKDVCCLGYNASAAAVRPSNEASRGKNGVSSVRMFGGALRVDMAQNGQLDIFNLKGGKVKTFKLRQGAHALKLNALPKGTYLINAKCGAWSRSIKTTVK